MSYWNILLLFAAFYLVNMGLSMRQMQNFSRTYARLREHGRVVIGKHQSLLSWGAIVMFRLDQDERVAEGVRLSGVTVFSRFRTTTMFDGARAGELGAVLDDRRRLPRSVRLAIANADSNFAVFAAGKMPEDPPGPFVRMFNRLSRKPRLRADNSMSRKQIVRAGKGL